MIATAELERPRMAIYARQTGIEHNDPDVLDIRRQIEALTEYADGIDAELLKPFVDKEHISPRPHRERRGFGNLLSAVRPGDYVAVQRFDQIGVGPGVIAAIRGLATRRVNLHILDFGDRGLLRVAADQVAGLAELLSEYKEGMAKLGRDETSRRVSQGTLATGKPKIGHKRTNVKVRGRTRQVDILDMGECDQIAEIARRNAAGESVYQIGRDFHERGLRTANGRRWVIYRRARGRRSELNCSRVRRARDWFRKREKEAVAGWME